MMEPITDKEITTGLDVDLTTAIKFSNSTMAEEQDKSPEDTTNDALCGQKPFAEYEELYLGEKASGCVHDRDIAMSSGSSDLQREALFPGREVGVLDNEGKPNELPVSKELEANQDYIKKGFKFGNTAEDENDQQLRDYWTQALQSRSSAGEIVEEIVKILKHHQNTHDLLCPVCGSCITKRIILRKRKRSSFISVDRLHQESTEEGVVKQLHEALTENVENGHQQDVQPLDEYEDTEAFGCMACFSIFLSKGQQIWSWVGAQGMSEDSNCLQLFFPPYPWGLMNQGPQTSYASGVPEMIEHPVSQGQSSQNADNDLGSTCEIGAALVPQYPWGKIRIKAKGYGNEIAQDECKDNVASQAMAPKSKVEAIGRHLVEEELGPIESGIAEVRPLLEGEMDVTCDVTPALDQKAEINVTCDVMSAVLPEYSWGMTTKAKEFLDVAGHYSNGFSERWTGRVCAYGLYSNLLPDYSWGTFYSYQALDDSPLSHALHGCKHPKALAKVFKDKSAMADQLHSSKKNSCTSGLVPVLLPDYQWGIFRENEETGERVPILEKWRVERKDVSWSQNGSHSLQDPVAGIEGKRKLVTNAQAAKYRRNSHIFSQSESQECACGLGEAILPRYPWGSAEEKGVTDAKKNGDKDSSFQIRSKQDIKEHVGERVPDEASESVTINQTLTVLNSSIVPEGSPQLAVGSEGSLELLPSTTGYALLDLAKEGSTEKNILRTRRSTGFAHGEVVITAQLPAHDAHIEEIEEVPDQTQEFLSVEALCMSQTTTSQLKKQTQREVNFSKLQTTVTIPSSAHAQVTETKSPITMEVPNFSSSVGKVSEGDVTDYLPKESLEGKGQTFISIFKASENLEQKKHISIFKMLKSSLDEKGLLAPLLPAASTKLKEPAGGMLQSVSEDATQTVIEVEPSSSIASQVVHPEMKRPRARDGWDILKPIVYGGLDISIASLGITSSAAGGNAVTRTVVYMGIATLFSGLIGFYHNVLNIYHYHKDHYTNVVGVNLLLHGTVALVSYVVFGMLSPLTYALSYRGSDDRDKKFLRCCIVTVACVFLLSLGKAKVSNKRYFWTVVAYMIGGVLAAIIGYLTGEHVAELLEEYGF